MILMLEIEICCLYNKFDLRGELLPMGLIFGSKQLPRLWWFLTEKHESLLLRHFQIQQWKTGRPEKLMWAPFG